MRSPHVMPPLPPRTAHRPTRRSIASPASFRRPYGCERKRARGASQPFALAAPDADRRRPRVLPTVPSDSVRLPDERASSVLVPLLRRDAGAGHGPADANRRGRTETTEGFRRRADGAASRHAFGSRFRSRPEQHAGFGRRGVPAGPAILFRAAPNRGRYPERSCRRVAAVPGRSAPRRRSRRGPGRLRRHGRQYTGVCRTNATGRGRNPRTRRSRTLGSEGASFRSADRIGNPWKASSYRRTSAIRPRRSSGERAARIRTRTTAPALQSRIRNPSMATAPATSPTVASSCRKLRSAFSC